MNIDPTVQDVDSQRPVVEEIPLLLWLIHLGEPIPSDPGARLFRYGILADYVVRSGGQVRRWAPTFVHSQKIYRAQQDKEISIGKRYTVELLHAKGYKNNISFQRIVFHRRMAKKFLRSAMGQGVPDVILCSMPTPDMCMAAIKYGRQFSVPVIIDVRDLWPDVFIDYAPRPFRPLMNLGLWPLFCVNKLVFRAATGIFGISDSYLEWGLRYAEREKGPYDGVFYMGYQTKTLSEDELAIEKRRWYNRGLQDQDFICCFFGTINYQFDLETVLQAAFALQNNGEKNFKFVVCGDGPLLKYYKQKAAGLNNVMFPGWVGWKEIVSLMELSKVGLAPYKRGAKMSIPNKPLEYLSAGLPVLSSLRGELEKILDEAGGGWTYDPGSPEQLINLLITIARDDKRLKEESEKARNLFDLRFSDDKIYPSMVEYLNYISESFKKCR